jgi:transcriptional regulator GlxA family with amidase domain/pimeloyl-ACP methyl ester carboxylesterase
MQRRIGFLAFDGIQALDIVGPADAFGSDAFASLNGVDGEISARPYEVVVIGLTGKQFTTSSGLIMRADATAGSRVKLDTLIIPGGAGLRRPGVADRAAAWIFSAASAVRRIASICTGIYGLAPTGLLDGRRVTTHWSASRDVASRFPRLNVDADAIFLKDGRFYTSAGVTAGIDLALALIEEDLGGTSALAVARELVVYFKRPGGQRQFSEPLRFQLDAVDRVGDLAAWIQTHLRADLGVDALAGRACLSVRQFSRAFKATFDTTPAAFVEEARVGEASKRLSERRVSIERVAHSVGYASEDVFCRAFERRFGISPKAYRTRFALTAVSLCIAALMPGPGAGAQQNGAGHWEGVMQRGRSTLSISVDFPAASAGGAAGGAAGFFTSGDLGAMDVPLKNVRVDDSTHWDLVGDQSTIVFTGIRTGNDMHGAFRENAVPGVFRLHRVSSSVEKPYTTSDVQFTSDGVTLSGTILAPRTAGKHAAVVFLHGSGAEGRWASHFTADYLARHNVVALIYDKRGVGASSGDWKTSSLEALAHDGRAAIHLLAQRNDVDPGRVGLFGHSQGGFIAPYVASENPEVRWIIDADGNVGPQYQQDLFRVGTALARRHTGADLHNANSLYREFVDVARNGLPHAQLRADEATFRNAGWLSDLAIPDDSSWIWGWYRRVGNDDNSNAWRSIDLPVLLLYGERDEVVPPRRSIAAITGLLRAQHSPRLTVRVLAGADHTLRVAPGEPAGWPHFAAGFPKLLSDWISRR